MPKRRLATDYIKATCSLLLPFVSTPSPLHTLPEARPALTAIVRHKLGCGPPEDKVRIPATTPDAEKLGPKFLSSCKHVHARTNQEDHSPTVVRRFRPMGSSLALGYDRLEAPHGGEGMSPSQSQAMPGSLTYGVRCRSSKSGRPPPSTALSNPAASTAIKCCRTTRFW